VVVVVESPAVDYPTGFFQAQEGLSVQEIVTQLDVEQLDVAIFPRAIHGDEQYPHIGWLEPAANRLWYELWTVVAA